MVRRRTRHGRSLLLTVLIAVLIGSATHLHSTMRADLDILGDGGSGSGNRGKSSSSKASEGKEESKSSKSSESGKNDGQRTGADGGVAGGVGGGVIGGTGDGVIGGGGSDADRERAEEERKRAEEEDRQHRVEEARKNTQPPVGGKKEDAQQGCFSISGEWTTDRALCMQPTPTLTVDKTEEHNDENRIKQAQEEELHRKMEGRYIASPESNQKRIVLLSLISETSQRLTALRDIGIITNPEQRQFVESSIEWLRGGETYFTENRSDEELDQMVGYIRQIAEYGQEVVNQARVTAANAGQIASNIGEIFLRTERLLLVFPDVLAILTREGIAVDPSLSTDYDTLVQYFQTMKTACASNGNSCNALDDVLTGMQHLQVSVQSAIAVAGKPEVENLIREVIQSRTK